jgi:hypothetical protein
MNTPRKSDTVYLTSHLLSFFCPYVVTTAVQWYGAPTSSPGSSVRHSRPSTAHTPAARLCSTPPHAPARGQARRRQPAPETPTSACPHPVVPAAGAHPARPVPLSFFPSVSMLTLYHQSFIRKKTHKHDKLTTEPQDQLLTSFTAHST